MPTINRAKVMDYFQNPNPTRFEKVMKDTEFFDKICKALDPIIKILKAIAELAHASPERMKGFEDGEKFVRGIRDGLGWIAIFGGGLRNVGSNVVKIYQLVVGLIHGTEVELKPRREVEVAKKGLEKIEVLENEVLENEVLENMPPKGADNNNLVQTRNPSGAEPFKTTYVYKLKHNEIAVKRRDGQSILRDERVWALGEEVSKLGGNVTFVLAFGMSRTAANLDKYCNVKTKAAKDIGETFGDLMLANHVCGVLASGCGLIYLQLALERAIENGEAPEKAVEEWEVKSWKMMVTLVLKLLEILHSSLKKLQTKKIIPTIPLWIDLPLSLIIGLLSVYSVWNRTA